MSRIITITSGKGGVGKTTSAINIGAALNKFGKDVIVLDANLTTPNVSLHLGAPIVPVNLNHVMQGKAKIHEAIYEHESGTKIVPSSLSVRDLKEIDTNKLRNIGRKLRKLADYIIYDSAAGLGDEATIAMECADEVVIVTNPEIPSVADALKTVKVAEQLGKDILGVVVTRVKGTKSEMPLENIEDMLELPILGIVPEDESVQEALVMKDAVLHTHPKSKASRAYRQIAAKIAGINYKEKLSFWEKLINW